MREENEEREYISKFTFIGLLGDTWSILKTTYSSYLKLFIILALSALFLIGLPIFLLSMYFVGDIGLQSLLTIGGPGVIGGIITVIIIFSLIYAFLGYIWNIGSMVIVNNYYETQTVFSFKELLTRIKFLVFPAIMLGLIHYLIVLGSLTLFILPAIIFTIWFSLSTQVFVSEGRKGMNALLASRDYLKKYTLRLILYSLAINIIFTLLFQVPVYIFQEFDLGIVGSIVSILSAAISVPFMVIFYYLFYRKVRAIEGDAPEATSERKRKYIVTALAGPVTILIVIIYMLTRNLGLTI